MGALPEEESKNIRKEITEEGAVFQKALTELELKMVPMMTEPETGTEPEII